MKRSALLVLVALAALVIAPSSAMADVGTDFDLTILPDVPAGVGDPISITLSNLVPGSLTFLSVGSTAGSFPFGELTTDLIPFTLLRLGIVPIGGTISFGGPLPANAAASLSGQTLLFQGVNIELTGVGTGLLWRKSNTDSLSGA